MLALALRLYQLARPGFLLGVTEYDDGVYFGSAVRLVHGVVPYRDFVLIQPPGIVLLMAPLALVSKAFGTAGAFAAARVLTACAGAASVALAGWLVRGRGPVAVTIACGLLAVYPSGINAAHTVLLEPWLVLLCLVGAVAAFEAEQLTLRRRRLTWAGIAFGLAAAIKLWALLPALALALVCWRALTGRHTSRYLAGVVAGFGVVVLPFFVLAPGSWFRDVIVAQLTRADVTRISVWERVQSLAGLSVLTPASHAAVALAGAVLAGFIVACAVAAWRQTRRPPSPLGWFAGSSGALICAAFLWPADYYPHYAWFFAPFLALALALPAARVVGAFKGRALIAAAAGAVAAVGGGLQFHQLSGLRSHEPSPVVRRATPAGACVLADIPTVTILADRFVSSVPSCSPLTDPIGTSYALSRGRNGVTGAARTPAVRATWTAAFAAAQYVWLQCPPWVRPQCLSVRRVPWTRALRVYFSRHFGAVPGQGRVANLYVRHR
jgi:hypothetical protein